MTSAATPPPPVLAPREDPDPGDVGVTHVLWGRALTSASFAAGLACWVLAILLRGSGLIAGDRDGASTCVAVLCLALAPVFWAKDAGRRRTLFRGVPRAWDDPSAAIPVDWTGTRKRWLVLNRGFVHADARRLRAVWGTAYAWDVLVVVAACLVTGLGDPAFSVMAVVLTFVSALILGLPRARRVAVDLDLSEVVEVHAGPAEFWIRTTRAGHDARLVFTTWSGDRDFMVEHLRAALGTKVHLEGDPHWLEVGPR